MSANRTDQTVTDRGDHVVVVDSMEPFYDQTIKENRINQLSEHPGFTFRHGDLNDPALLDEVFEQFQPTTVCHLAGSAVRLHNH